jgi:DNA-binding PadR family transcriptional regulator
MTPGRASRTTLEYALIGLIRQMPRSGYELRKVFVETAMAGYSGSPGAIYPALRRLEADGLIQGTERPGGPGRTRREYRLTLAGEAVLQEWLALPVTRDDVALRLDELMLRFAFLGYAADSRARTLEFLASLEAHLEAFLDDLQQQLRAIDAASRHIPVTHARLALEAGISSIADRLRWARAARARLSTSGAET